MTLNFRLRFWQVTIQLDQDSVDLPCISPSWRPDGATDQDDNMPNVQLKLIFVPSFVVIIGHTTTDYSTWPQ